MRKLEQYQPEKQKKGEQTGLISVIRRCNQGTRTVCQECKCICSHGRGRSSRSGSSFSVYCDSGTVVPDVLCG